MLTNRETDVKRILVTGASGLLGLNFCCFFHKKYDVFGIVNTSKLAGLPFKTIRCNLITNAAGDLLDEAKPDIVLHCAAMANIDQCEKNPKEARTVLGALFPEETDPKDYYSYLMNKLNKK